MGSSQSSPALDPHQPQPQPSRSSKAAAAGIQRVGGRKSNKNGTASANKNGTAKVAVPGGGSSNNKAKALLFGGGKKEPVAAVGSDKLGATEGGAAASSVPGLVGSFVSEPTTTFFVVDSSSRELSEEVVVDVDVDEATLGKKEVVVESPSETQHHHLEGLVEEEEIEEDEDGGAVLVPSDVSSDDEDDSEDDDDEDDELWEERLRILEDAKSLKAVATWFLRPEVTVSKTPFGTASNYFDRASIQKPLPTDTDEEVEEEMQAALQDAQALKASARAYLHPEDPVGNVDDPCATGRNYFGRASAPQYEDDDETKDDRDTVWADLQALKACAIQYLHPELPVKVCASSCARNYFSRPSAPQYEDDEEEELEREDALQDATALKAAASSYLHPERPVLASPFACARNFFTRASAPEAVEEEDDAGDREAALEDAQRLKASAAKFLHPERPIEASPSACARSYFTRPSAPEYEEGEQDLERDYALQDAMMLKASAVQYLHPELPVSSSPSACARSYFTRASAPEHEDDLERNLALQDATMLKASAAQYLHPELPVSSSPSACARNYFSRASAPEYEEDEQDLERDYAMADVKALKAAAAQYLHPELPVKSSPSACARNYFTRASAPEHEDVEADLERDYAMEDVKALKASASMYLHPETAVSSSIAVTRAAPFGMGVVMDERATILEEMKQLKALAAQYLHPEKPITVSAEATARCFFTRPSADAYESEEDAVARAEALNDSKTLKALAAQYRAPEAPVVVDPEVTGRNYFDRMSAPASVDEENDNVDSEEREQILADALALKKLAVDFLHPEQGMAGRFVSGGRSYFDRPSARGHDHMVHTFPAHEDDLHHDDHHHDEHMDHFGMDEEMEARFDDLRNHLPMGLKSKAAISGMAQQGSAGSDEEGKLSRSPSSVMLFTEESIYD